MTSGIDGRFLLADDLDQSLILRVPMLSVVDLAVAARADRTHEPRIVWTSVTETAGMMGLEVGLPLQGDERRWLVAALADTSGSGEDIAADNCRSPVEAPASCGAYDLRCCLGGL